MNSTNFPPTLLRLGMVSAGVWGHGRWSMTIDGIVGWCASLPQGLCIGCRVGDAPIDGRWLEQASLWVISQCGESDDALWIDASNALVFVRRHDATSTDAALRAGLEQQVAIARWLSAHHAALRDTPCVAWR